MGILDEILKELEKAQREAEGRGRPDRAPSRPERESDEDGAEWEEDEAARPGHAPHIPPRRSPAAEQPAPPPEPAAVRTTQNSGVPISTAVRGPDPSVALRAALLDRSRVRDALILREILGPPPGLRRMRRR
jgi:hypothetical protein